ncbi:MAG: 3-oxoadipyl-CoA thiolase [Saccharospirillum sp.]
MTAVYICDFQRTPIGRFGGALAQLRPDDMAAELIKALLQRTPQLDPARIDDVLLGCANQAGEDNRNVARMAVLLAGLPESVPGVTLNRLCGSGLDAVMAAARQIKCGEAEVILAGGVESMTRAPFVMPKATSAFSRQTDLFDTTIGWRFINPQLQRAWGTESMPETAENVAAHYGVERDAQDRFALASQHKAGAAIRQGRFQAEICPVTVTHGKTTVTVSEDEHPRPETTLEKLTKLPTPFRGGGTVTAGNASGVNDGAALLLIASEAAVKAHQLTPLARVGIGTSVGVHPGMMGIGPVPAVQRLLQRSQLRLTDIGLIELNEAFAAQALACLRELGLDDGDERVNPNGGAIALGHPLGATGARLAGTAALELHQRGLQHAVISLCVGVGQGLALHLAAP